MCQQDQIACSKYNDFLVQQLTQLGETYEHENLHFNNA